jgi:predicted dehydrogenase
MSVLVIGAGPTAIAYGRVLSAMGASWTVVGRGPKSASEFAAATGREPLLGGLSAFLGMMDRPIDAAIVAIPIRGLAAAVKALLDAGARRILVEKPAGLDADEIDGVARATTATSRQSDVFVAYNRRFYSSVTTAKRLIEEDGGVTSFHIDFTEIADRVRASVSDQVLLRNWFLANSSHVIDLAFSLGGEPVDVSGLSGGSLDWHPPGAGFVGHGRTKSGAIFSWHADWGSAGRWGLDLRTRHRRLILQPLEALSVQEKGSFAISPFPIADELDRQFKPGFYRQVEAFLSDQPGKTRLPTIAAHAEMVRRWYSIICPPAAARQFPQAAAR